MSEVKKINCKYWDKCYQKNPAHHEKYNHPPKSQQKSLQESSDTSSSSSSSSSTSSTSSNDNETINTKRKIQTARMQTPSKKSKTSSVDKKSERTASKSPTSRKDTVSPSLRSHHIDSPGPEEHSRSPIPHHSTKHDDDNEMKLSVKPKQGEDDKEMDITDEYNEVMRNLEGKNYFEIFQRRVRYSQKAEYQDLLKTPEFIRHKFLVEMPAEFYKFWDFCVYTAEKNPNKQNNNPQDIFEKFGLKLVGPFDYLSGKFNTAKICEPANYLRHWRFYYDPPEFQTIFVKTKICTLHYGYWRDEPKDKENLLMAKNDADKGCEFEFVGGNCFETILYYLDKDCQSTPFNSKQITDMKKSIQDYAEENHIQLNSLESIKKARDKKMVCKTFHKAGLVVPFNRKTELGYRPLIESDINIKKILSKFEKAEGDKNKLLSSVLEALQPIITAANIAVDECDFGTAVELGIDLFCSGYKELHDVVRSLLIPGYSMLQRPQFIAIMKSHLEDRKKGYQLSIFE